MVKLLGTCNNVMRCVATMMIILLFPFFLSSQTPDSTQQTVFTKTNVQYFTLDPLGNLLAISKDGILSKYNPEGDLLFVYNNTVLGELASTDASDPFNILLFYPEQQSLVLLDRTLNERSILDLRESAIGQASCAILSLDNNIWVYDDFESQLIKIDANGNTLLQSDNLRLTENISEAAAHLFRWKDKILVNFPSRGIAVFNLFAQLENWWPVHGLLDGQALPTGLSYYNGEGFFQYLPHPDLNISFIGQKFKNCRSIRKIRRHEYLLHNDGTLTVFRS